MKLLIVNQEEATRLLPMAECIDLMAETLKALGRGEAHLPLRQVMWLPERVGALGAMPAYLANVPVMGIKVVSAFAGNHGTQFQSHMGAVMIFDTKYGQPLALVDASSITAIRTAAVSGVATRLLARDDAGDLAILGSGVQAQTHLEAMKLSRNIRRVRVWSRDPVHALRFAGIGSRDGLAIEVSDSVESAVDGADIICTTTAAREPILQGKWLMPGVHINAVGSSAAFARELDTEAVVRSRLFVDRRESTVNEAGDFLFPKQEGAVQDNHIIGELGDVALGTTRGRQSENDITLFKSLGLAIEDVASAHHIYLKALALNVGVRVDFGGDQTVHA